MASDLEYALLAGDAYISSRPTKLNRFPIPEGWIPVENSHRSDEATGYESIAYTNGSEIVLSFAGTNPAEVLTDVIKADGGLGLGIGNSSFFTDVLVPNQLLQAASSYIQLRLDNANTPISLTGHSLGGGLASLVAVFFDVQATTFDQAPFRNSASFMVAAGVLSYLKRVFPVETNPGITSLLQPLTNFILSFDPLGLGLSQDGLAVRETNVKGYNVQGEFLSLPLPIPVSRIGTSKHQNRGQTTITEININHGLPPITLLLRPGEQMPKVRILVSPVWA